jgi:hypothetical protein
MTAFTIPDLLVLLSNPSINALKFLRRKTGSWVYTFSTNEI